MQDNFLMFPNNLIWNYEDNDNTYLKKYGDKIIHIFSYLQVNTGLSGKVNFTIEDLIITAGLTPKSGKNKTNEQFKNILEDLKLRNILNININFNFTKAKIDKLIKLEFNIPFIRSTKGDITHFFIIKINDYLRIMDKYEGQLDKLILLKIFLYINARISRRKNDDIAYFSDNNRNRAENINITGGKAQCFYDSYINISNNLKISQDTFKRYIKELHELELIFYSNIGVVEDEKHKRHTANNVYCVCANELNEGLKQSKLYYKEQGYKILGNKDVTKVNKINGLKGKIQQEKNLNKDVIKLERKLKQLKSENHKNNTF